jgi:hypothetical protein
MPSRRAGAQTETSGGSRSTREHGPPSRTASIHEEQPQFVSYAAQGTAAVSSSASASAHQVPSTATTQSVVVAEPPQAIGQAAPMPALQVQCFVCGSHLSLQPGSAWILCPCCVTVLSLQPMLDPRAYGGHTICPSCHFIVYFPVECRQATCVYCSFRIDVAPPQQITCTACRSCLLYNATSTSPIMCLVCQTVMQPDGQIIQPLYGPPSPFLVASPVFLSVSGTSTVTPPSATPEGQFTPLGRLHTHQQAQLQRTSRELTQTTQFSSLERTGGPSHVSQRTSTEISTRPMQRDTSAQQTVTSGEIRAPFLLPSPALQSSETVPTTQPPQTADPGMQESSSVVVEAPRPASVSAGAPSAPQPTETSASVQRSVAPSASRTTSAANESASSGTSAESASSPSLARAS